MNAGMPPLKCLIVDDELIATKIIANYAGKVDFLQVEAVCSSSVEAAGMLQN